MVHTNKDVTVSLSRWDTLLDLVGKCDPRPLCTKQLIAAAHEECSVSVPCEHTMLAWCVMFGARTVRCESLRRTTHQCGTEQEK